jgi:hypothetical protein
VNDVAFRPHTALRLKDPVGCVRDVRRVASEHLARQGSEVNVRRRHALPDVRCGRKHTLPPIQRHFNDERSLPFPRHSHFDTR